MAARIGAGVNPEHMSDDPKLPDASNAPAPEALQTQEDMSETVEESTVSVSTGSTSGAAAPQKRRIAYRPSHKATFIGLTVVALILAANAIIISHQMCSFCDLNERKRQT
jgi:hypothetical protein